MEEKENDVVEEQAQDESIQQEEENVQQTSSPKINGNVILANGLMKALKLLPPNVKIVIALVIVGLILFLMIILCGAAYVAMGEFGNDDTNTGDIGYTLVGNNSALWWPVGSIETTVENGVKFASGTPSSIGITSYYGPRPQPTPGASTNHKGIDISRNNQGNDYHNIIASLAGSVTKVVTVDPGSGRGCYVRIAHSNGYETISQHLHCSSIFVSVGDTVQQGQVIAKMGSSGVGTGTHLHFELYVGGQTVDPLLYVDPNNPRPVSSATASGLSEQGFRMLQSFEGTGPTSGNNYLAYKDAVGVLTIGYGVTIENNRSRFQARGINPSSIGVGTAIPMSVVDEIKYEIVKDMYNSVNNTLASNNISLKTNQVEALVIRMYNTGNIKNFPSNYKKYGDTQALYDSYMSKPVTGKGGIYLSGLAKRRALEWELFHNGIYSGQ